MEDEARRNSRTYTTVDPSLLASGLNPVFRPPGLDESRVVKTTVLLPAEEMLEE